MRKLAVAATPCWFRESVHTRTIYPARQWGTTIANTPQQWVAVMMTGNAAGWTVLPRARDLSESDDPHLEDGNTRRSRATGTASRILQVTPTGQ